MTPYQTLVEHLNHRLGLWPPPAGGVTVVGSPRRLEPGWDGRVRPVVGVRSPEGAVLSVPPDRVEEVRGLGRDLDRIASRIAVAVGRPGWRFHAGTLRWSDEPAPGDDPGVWLPRDHPDVLGWLRPFNGDVLVGYEDSSVAAGVGRKQHDRWGHELAVVTEPAFRGRGWARRLVSQAARRVLADGAVPIYLHPRENIPSARTADAAGFPDRGWQVLGLFPPSP